MERKIICHDIKHDGQSARIELHLKSQYTEGTATWEGAIRQYSCDAQTLRDRFNDNLDEFVAWAVKDHGMIEDFNPEIVKSLHEQKGKVIG